MGCYRGSQRGHLICVDFLLMTPLRAEMSIQGQDAHHISRVLRLQVGDRLVVVAPDGSAGIAEIKSILRMKVVLAVARNNSRGQRSACGCLFGTRIA